MKIALIYPPPWKIAGPDEAALPASEGPPEGYCQGDLDGDFYQIPQGLLSLAAHCQQAGHQVKVLNLSNLRWSAVEEVIASLDADLFGLSCWTANRRGVAFAAASIRRLQPEAHIVVGGPHAAPLAREMLAHHEAIDTIAIGESELTLLELAARIEAGKGTQAIAGTAYREAGQIRVAKARPQVKDLDELASPYALFDTHILMTSRGCPWSCTFCGAESQWGRGFRAHSVERVLDTIEQMVSRLPVKQVLVKDDTFTTQRKRVLAICRGIRERGLKFAWSCDTRVDLLNDELLREMRLAGCERLSLGVESGSKEILEQIDKKITAEDIIASTEAARSYGIKVRYFMMLGNRGETQRTFDETLAFLERARPHEYIFSCLSIYPGTQDFYDAEKAGWLDRGSYFRETFQELKSPFDADQALTQRMSRWFQAHRGLQRVYQPDVAECEAIVVRLGEHAPAYLDLAGACYREERWQLCEEHALKALELGHALPGLALNYLACVAVQRKDYQSMMEHFSKAAELDPQHAVLIANINKARAWFRQGGAARNMVLDLEAHHEFQLLERTLQPMLPGPLPDDLASWPEPSPAARYPLSGASESGADEVSAARRKLDILSEP